MLYKVFKDYSKGNTDILKVNITEIHNIIFRSCPDHLTKIFLFYHL